LALTVSIRYRRPCIVFFYNNIIFVIFYVIYYCITFIAILKIYKIIQISYLFLIMKYRHQVFHHVHIYKWRPKHLFKLSVDERKLKQYPNATALRGKKNLKTGNETTFNVWIYFDRKNTKYIFHQYLPIVLNLNN